MERYKSFAATTRCHEKLVWDWQTFAVMQKVLEDSFLFLRVTKVEKKVNARFAAPATSGTVFITPADRLTREPKPNKP